MSTQVVLFALFALVCIRCQFWLSSMAMRWDRIARRRYTDVTEEHFPFRYRGFLYPNPKLSAHFTNTHLRTAHAKIMAHWGSVSKLLLTLVLGLLVLRMLGL